MIPEHRELLRTFLNNYHVRDVDACLYAFELFSKELIRWNKVINLTSIEDEYDIVVKHFIDSLIPLKFIEDKDFILDIGSGAGFPGIPIKIVKPSIKLVMLDARLKKINFINSMINLLKLTGVTALHQRAEAKDFQGLMGKSFDAVISRAAFQLSELTALALPYMKDSGRLIVMKAKEIEDMDNVKGFKQIDGLVTALPDGSPRRIMVFGIG